ncbi:MAG: GAF domain-containing protein, partial [Myxococcota bacterium]
MAFLVLKKDGSEDRFPLFKNITRLGSDPGNDVALSGDGVSADHAHILREGDEFIIAALGRGRPLSINGKKEKRARLADGDAITVGEVALEFVASDLPEGDVVDALDPTTRGAIASYSEIVAFSRRLMESQDLDQLLTALMDKVVELSRADKGFLVLMSDGVPDIRIARNLDQEDVSREIQELSDTVLAKVVREQQPVVVTDALNDQEFKASASIVNLKLSSVMCVPLMEDG